MNDTPKQQKQKDSILKSLAVVGFIGIIILIAWLSIQLVGLVPGAFSSLASLAETMNQRQETTEIEITPLTVTSNTTLTNVGEVVTITWNTAKAAGSYTFSYKCTDGVAIDLLNIDGIKSINCDTNYNIGDTDSLTLTIDSEKMRFADLQYTVSFLGTNDTKPRAVGSNTITVINSDIHDSATSPDTDVTAPDTPTEDVTDVAPVATDTQTNTPAYEQEYVYTIPTSDPNGRSDLGTRFLATGTIINDVFFPEALERNEDGAIQFEVKNHGTKTSDEWDFSVTLPNGDTYRGNDQKPLKPNERAIIVIGFPAPKVSQYTFTVTVDTPSDYSQLNDHFFETVNFVR